MRDHLMGIFAKAAKGVGLELVKRMRRAVGERVVGYEAIADVVLLFADHFAEFQRKRRRNGNRARKVFVIVHHTRNGSGRGRQNAADNVAGVVAADAGDDRIQVAGLTAQVAVG